MSTPQSPDDGIHLSLSDMPQNMVYRSNVGSMLGQRLRRWPNIEATLDAYLVAAGIDIKPCAFCSTPNIV